MDKSPTQWMIEPLRKYATFSGRARRKEYWWYVLFSTLLALVAAVVTIATSGLDAAADGNGGYLQGFVSLALFLPSQAVLVRRLHDVDRSGWWLVGYYLLVILMVVVSVMVVAAGDAAQTGVIIMLSVLVLAFAVGCITMFVWICSRGTIGDNRFGPDPIGD